jgi:hypothetical protein
MVYNTAFAGSHRHSLNSPGSAIALGARWLLAALTSLDEFL